MSETDTDIAEENTGFLNRWSQRKHQQSEDDKQKQQAIDAKDEAIQQEEVLKTDADMPPLENLTEDSDYSGFLSPKVSEVLRRQALRKLFHMPSLNVVDGLDDYAEDFTSFTPLGDLVTEEMKRVFAREKEKLEKEKLEQEQLDQEQLDQEQLDQEQLDQEQLDQEKQVRAEAEENTQPELAEERTGSADAAEASTALDTEDTMLCDDEADSLLAAQQLTDNNHI